MAEGVRAARSAEPLVLVGHSGADALLPSVAAACDAAVAAAVFVDAILPHPGASWFDGVIKLKSEGVATDAERCVLVTQPAVSRALRPG